MPTARSREGLRLGSVPGRCGTVCWSWASGVTAVHALVNVDQGGDGVGVLCHADPLSERGEDGHLVVVCVEDDDVTGISAVSRTSRPWTVSRAASPAPSTRCPTR